MSVTDVCGVEQQSGAKAAAGGGGTVLFEADGRNGAPLVVDPRMTKASVSTTISAADQSGKAVTIVLRAT